MITVIEHALIVVVAVAVVRGSGFAAMDVNDGATVCAMQMRRGQQPAARNPHQGEN